MAGLKVFCPRVDAILDDADDQKNEEEDAGTDATGSNDDWVERDPTKDDLVGEGGRKRNETLVTARADGAGAHTVLLPETSAAIDTSTEALVVKAARAGPALKFTTTREEAGAQKRD